MDRRERLRRCYCHEELDRPAVYTRTGYPAGDTSYDRLRAFMAEHSELKGGWNGMRLAAPLPTEERAEPISADWERRITTLHTPAGDLTASRRVSLRGQPGLPESYFVSTREDAEKYLSLPDPVYPQETDGFFSADAAMGDRGIVEAHFGLNAAGYVAGEVTGSESFALLSVTDRDVLHALCERRMAQVLARLKWLIARGVGPYFAFAGQEYLTPPLHGPRDFDDFNVRYDRPLFDLVHDAGGRVHVHCHGAVKRVMAGFLAESVDVLHPFEAPPMGDLTPAGAKAAARGRICLEGNIQIADMYGRTPAEVREQTEALIAACFDDRRGLIVSPTASPYIRDAGEDCFPQYRAMVEAVHGWRA